LIWLVKMCCKCKCRYLLKSLEDHISLEIYTYDTKEIYQVDIMDLRGLYKRLSSYIINTIKPNRYVLVAVDVYSRLFWASSMPDRKKDNIRKALYNIIHEMDKPFIISADNEIINVMYMPKSQFVHDIFKGIETYRTSPSETNKNAIIERWIRTIKGRIMKYLADKYINVEPPTEENMSDLIVKQICYELNHTKHRGINAILIDVWVGKDTNRKPIVKFNYPTLNVGDLVLRTHQPPVAVAVIYARTFDVDLDLYVVNAVVGNK